LKEDNDSMIDIEKPIGFLYFENGKDIYFEATKNKSYRTFDELFAIFTSKCYYGIGEKIIS